MALTEEEEKIARAYNIGYRLSESDPKLLSKIIKSNPKNDLVKVMQLARDHQEFHVNIPRKDYSRQYKNGFYNGRVLAENEPGLIDRLLNSNGLSKDFKNGMAAAKLEYDMFSLQQRANSEKSPQANLTGKAPAPDWLQKKTGEEKFHRPTKGKDKGFENDK